MASYLIDLVLMVALVVTALRSGRMVRELKTLRQTETGLAAALEESDRALTRAAEMVVFLKHEGAETARALETRTGEAREIAGRLEALVARADWHASGRAAPRRMPGAGTRAAAEERGADHRLRASLAG